MKTSLILKAVFVYLSKSPGGCRVSAQISLVRVEMVRDMRYVIRERWASPYAIVDVDEKENLHR